MREKTGKFATVYVFRSIVFRASAGDFLPVTFPRRGRPSGVGRFARAGWPRGLSNASIYRHMREGTFPPPIRVSERTVRWRSDDLITWLDSLTRQK